ncbi:hypothetical protein ABT030_39015 [Streptomyces mirabilis]|uniref:hypothetical protein n=1 Tax=Streptomyces mirabilis TaxID=68239 RepID=UPI00332FD17F
MECGTQAGCGAEPVEVLREGGTVDMMSLRPEMVGGNDSALELEAVTRSAEVMLIAAS